MSSVADRPDVVAAVVVDASAMVEALIGTRRGLSVRIAMRSKRLIAPAHFDAEVLSALGRLHRDGSLDSESVARALAELESAPIERRALATLITGAWAMRDRFRLVDALYVALSEAAESPLLTTDARLGRAYPAAIVIQD